MKTAIKFLTLIVFAMTMISCGGKDGKDRGRVGSGRDGRDRARDDDNSFSRLNNGSGGDGWGQVYADGGQDEFQAKVMWFTSSNMDPLSSTQGMGYVSGNLSDSTGIWIAGDVEFERGRFDGDTAPSEIDEDKAAFAMIIWDSYASETDSSGQEIGGYGFSQGKAYYSMVEGNRAIIEWKDSAGHVWLDGVFNRDYFEGYIYFYNLRSQNTQFATEQVVRLGQFYVPTCSFFRCN
ncbi:MAG: hypothetical protein HRT45_10325 [Bdellovibrionales bacterium]|nr:hypothetical protein [Bdellovibrionales bacterium]